MKDASSQDGHCTRAKTSNSHACPLNDALRVNIDLSIVHYRQLSQPVRLHTADENISSSSPARGSRLSIRSSGVVTAAGSGT